MTVDDARRQFEAEFVVWPALGDSHTSPAGVPYVTIVNNQIKPEGDVITSWATCEDIGASLWLAGALEYAKDKVGVLFWREYPTWEWAGADMLSIDGRPLGRGVVYSRLAIGVVEGPW